ncbi:MAG TPA: alginate lyase family protein [Candidatus Acidoferrales bacterium]|nr:alginate lyase family protein [Candidatus Acidoferrales bacterium]
MRDKRPIKNHQSGIALRLASMDRAELVDRIRQELQKRADAILFGLGLDTSRGELRRVEAGSRRFFFRSEDVPRWMDLLRERMPQQAEAIVERAEKICSHRFDLLGYQELDYGGEIDWHSDRVHGKRAPRDLWFKIRYLDFASVGDAKVTWELNRHQHLVTLAKAYRLTNDHRFASELIDQWRHWQSDNPYPRGINWASSLEVAFRSLSWMWVYFLLEGTPAMTPEFREQWLRAMALSGRHIELYLSTYFSPNTHLLGEAVALFFIGTLCPELCSSSRWKRRGWEIVLRESERQVRPDGFHFEQSTYYHVYALDFLLHARVLASLNDMPFPPEYDRRLEQMLDALAVLCRAGAPPGWGDDDGGRVFDPRRNRAEHLSDPLATGAVLFGRGDFKMLAGGLREETLWLLGEQGVAEFDRLEAKQPGMSSVALPETGLYVMSCNERKLQAVIDAGPQGALAAGHGHADALSLTLHADEHELLGDPGTYEYVGTGTERDQFRGTAAHNTLQLDGRNQSEPNGPFAWKCLTKAKTENWISGQTFDLFVGSHDGYSQPDNPAIHRRWVFFRKPKFWLVRDLMLGTGKHQLDLRWHLAPELFSSRPAEGRFVFPKKRGGIALFSPAGESWSETVEQGTWSAAYGMKEPATTVRFTAVTTLPAEFAAVFAPIGMSPEDANVQATLTQVSSPPLISVYRFVDGREEHCFIFAQDKSWTFDEWKSDAEFVYCCSTNGKLNLLVVCNGTHVEFRGNRVVFSPKHVLRCEIIYSQGKIQVICSEDDILVSQEGMSKCFEGGAMVTRQSDEASR